MLALDVSPQQLERQAELLRRLTEPQRSALVAGLWDTGRRLAEAGVRARNPGASGPLLRWLLTALIYGDATALRLHARLTHDLDFVVDLHLAEIDPFVRALGADFEVDEPALADAVRQRRSWNIFHVPTVTRVDCSSDVRRPSISTLV